MSLTSGPASQVVFDSKGTNQERLSNFVPRVIVWSCSKAQLGVVRVWSRKSCGAKLPCVGTTKLDDVSTVQAAIDVRTFLLDLFNQPQGPIAFDQ